MSRADPMSDTFFAKMTHTCVQNELNGNDVSFHVRSILECSALCSSYGTTTCVGFSIMKNNGYISCVLLSHCSSNECSSSNHTDMTRILYQRTTCSGFTSSTTTSLDMTTETSTVQQQTTALDCGTAGTLVNNQCQCQPGCSGPICRNCPQDCSHDTGHGFESLYITITGFDNPVKVLCNTAFGIGRLTYIQFRRNGDVNFNRSWVEYENGFGDVDGDFWLGNIYIAALLKQKQYNVGFRKYDSFGLSASRYENIAVEDTEGLYRLRYGSLLVGEDGLSPLDGSMDAYGQIFSTYDRDPTGCARLHGSGWWYNTGCSLSNLNSPMPVTFGSKNNIIETGIGLFI